jgi:energy-coupling factor transporter ATP-binding protein EcfA2
MAQVLLARDTRLGRKVAIKFLNSVSDEFTQRFLVEARATAQCNHENIVVIHEVNAYQGVPFMVLEFLEGESLVDLLRGRKLPPGRAVELIIPVVRALVRAHEFNIVHRDLKPGNIFITRQGVVKVLDFGIAKLFSEEGVPDAAPIRKRPVGLGDDSSDPLTHAGTLVGTSRYMSPEQWGSGTVDHRSDIWAVGIILYRMVAGMHPLAHCTSENLAVEVAISNIPMPGVGQEVPELPGNLERIIDRCLAKPKSERFSSAMALLEALEPLQPGRYGRQLGEGESPYPGMSAFQESDADRFFGRSRDTRQAVARIREHPLLGVVGPSGVGKSSFVRAGVVVALKASGENWEVLITRPGRNPLTALASVLQPLVHSQTSLTTKMSEHEALVTQLRQEPGYLGTLLRSRARQKQCSILLFVDQLEELYTLVPSAEERAAYTACLSGAADDVSTPLRVVISMRSDFLDRVGEDRRFMEDLSRSLVFLQPPDRYGLKEALTQPVGMVGYSFESPSMVDHMLDALEHTSGSLPLLQFAAAKLWESRDRGRRLLTQQSYMVMGGIAGALATHANEVLASFPPSAQNLIRAIFQRLVTPDGTRAIVDVEELTDLSPDSNEVQRIIDRLVLERLLVVQTRSETEGPVVEIVHESLISTWPTLRWWLEESQEDSAFLDQLRTASKQWDTKSRPQGLLWRGEAMEEARLWQRHYQGKLVQRERQFLDAGLAVATRSTRIKRALIGATIAILTLLVVAAGLALLWVRNAERKAKEQATLARKEAKIARAAEKRIAQQIEVIRTQEREKKAAQKEAATGKKKLTMSRQQLSVALKQARQEKKKAEKATKRTKELLKRTQELLARERARVVMLRRRKRKIATDLR